MLQREMQEGVAVLRVEHGKVGALDVELCDDIATTFAALAHSDARAAVLTGTGSAFSAGVDLHRVVAGGAAYVERFLPALDRALEAVFACPLPVVAAVNGHALAGGCVLACACDQRLMSDGKGRVGVPELLVGVPFPWLALEILRATTPRAHIAELVYRGRTYPPAEALARGLVDEIVAPEQLMPRALELARSLGAVPREAFCLAKAQLRDRVLEERERRREHDAFVLRAWRDPATHARISTYLEATLAKK